MIPFENYPIHTAKFFNLTPDNLEILIIQHLITVVPKVEVLLFTRQRFIDERGKSHGHVQNGLKECLYINHSVIF